MLERHGLVPHFEVTDVHGVPVTYGSLWQRRNLVLVTLPAGESEAATQYVIALTSRTEELDRHDAECVVTRDAVDGLPPPGALVADRWGEIVLVATAPDTAALPPAEELLDWLQYLQSRCPECEGEAK